MDNGFLAFALLALASVLIVAEVFLPSAGMLTVGMFICLFASFYCAWTAWWETQPILFSAFVGFAIVLLPGVTIGALAWLPRTRWGKKIFLQAPTEAEVVPFAQEQEHLDKLVGRIAKTITPLNPGGMILIDRERIHAHSEGMVIERDTPVEILRATGTRVLVRAVDEVVDENENPPVQAPPPALEKDDEADPFALNS